VTGRHAGVQLPLFSARSTSSWGIGELPDLEPLADWLAAAGFDRLLLLPIGTMGAGETSPYSAASTMAIDPFYIAIDRVEDFVRAGGLDAWPAHAREHVEAARRSRRIAYDAVRGAKHAALDLAFARFLAEEWGHLTTRAADLAAFIARERWWLDDYALFQALEGMWPGVSWRDWPAPVRDRDAQTLDEGRRHLWREILKQQYWQWIADAQWQGCHRAARARGVSLIGDLPFVASQQSAEVWARPHEFLLDVSLGVPPDAFSATGQDWGLPTYNWQAIAATDYAWIRQRARRMAALYDGVRIDHLVGFFRTYGRPRGGAPFFNPAHERQQIAQGEAILRIFLETRSALVGEDLGVVPDFVRAVMAHLDVPGCKVLRWERAWDLPGQPFIETAEYPPVSAALTGTHDTEPLALWWEVIDAEEREALTALPALRARGIRDPTLPWNDALRDAMLEIAYTAGSRDLFLPLQDVFGWRDRINTPGTVRPENWSWTLPWPVDRLNSVTEALERAEFCRTLSGATGRRR